MTKHLSLFGIALTLISASCNDDKIKKASQTTQLIVDIKGAKFDTLLVQQIGNSSWETLDTVVRENGLFFYNTKLESADLIKLSSTDKSYQARVFIESGDIHLVDSAENSNPVISESAIHDQFKSVNDSTEQYQITMSKALDEYQNLTSFDDSVLVQTIIDRYDFADSLRLIYIENWIAEHPNSVVAQYLYLVEKMNYASAEELNMQLQLFDSSLANTSIANRLRARATILKTIAIGANAPIFTMADSSGNMIASNSVYGKVTLLDFWASWCGPCRQENPNVVAAFEKYHGKGFEILGISLDQDAARWKKAIIDDHLTWSHVSDLKGWQSKAGALYGVNSIPFSILVDENGIIIAKDLRGEELHKKLKELLN